MGQVALGFRSLLVRAAVFFIMAALLAWALGGTLWPRAVGVFMKPVPFNGKDWSWRAVIDEASAVSTSLEFRLWFREKGNDHFSDYTKLAETVVFEEVLPLLVSADDLIIAGMNSVNGTWKIYRVDTKGEISPAVTYPDRLAVVKAWSKLADSSVP